MMLEFVSAIKSRLQSLAKTGERLIVASDSEELFVDKGGERIQIRDIIRLSTDAERTATLAPLDKLYFVVSTGKLWSYRNGWECLNPAQESSAIRLPACTGIGVQYAAGGNVLSWIDPDDVFYNGAELARWEKTVLVCKEGSYPESAADGTVVAQTVRAEGTKNAYRNGFTDAGSRGGSGYCYRLFSQTESGPWNDLAANSFPNEDVFSWGLVQKFVREGLGATKFPVGTVFEISHGEYKHPDGTGLTFRVVGHDQVPAADESLTHTMCLEMTDALFAAPLDAAEKTYGFTEDEYAQAGKTYYKMNTNDYTYTELVEGTDYKVGDLIVGKYEKNTGVRDQLGYSRFSQSNLLQWLNSTASSVHWFEDKSIWDIFSQVLIQKNGFCQNLDAEFLAAVSPARITTALPAVDGGGLETTDAKFWILSYSQVYGLKNNDIVGAVMENECLEWYSHTNNKLKYPIGGGSSYVKYWLRSVYKTDDGRNLLVPQPSSGVLYTYSANPEPWVVPACIIA